jgi:hypothetical protein
MLPIATCTGSLVASVAAQLKAVLKLLQSSLIASPSSRNSAPSVLRLRARAVALRQRGCGGQHAGDDDEDEAHASASLAGFAPALRRRGLLRGLRPAGAAPPPPAPGSSA